MNMTRRRRAPGAVILAALAVVGVSVPVAAEEEASLAPVLWEGAVETAGGRPAEVEVVAYRRPAGASLRDGDELVPIAAARTDGQGRFTLRAPEASLADVADEAGWATVMLAAASSDGMVLAVDSVAWQPDRSGVEAVTAQTVDGAQGRWVTAPSERANQQAVTAASAEGESPVGDSAQMEEERPRTLVLAPAPGGGRVTAAQATTGPRGHPKCVVRGSEPVNNDLPLPVLVGELHRERHWAGEFKYTNTSTSSFQVGYSVDGKVWKVAGSTSFHSGGDHEEGSTSFGYEQAENQLVFRQYFAEMLFRRFTWRCGEPYWYDVFTVEPVEWTGGLDPRPGLGPAACDPTKKSKVGARRGYERATSSAETHGRAFSVLGFGGSATTTVSKHASFTWVNEFDELRFLCGETAFPNQRTRVVSLP